MRSLGITVEMGTETLHDWFSRNRGKGWVNCKASKEISKVAFAARAKTAKPDARRGMASKTRRRVLWRRTITCIYVQRPWEAWRNLDNGCTAPVGAFTPVYTAQRCNRYGILNREAFARRAKELDRTPLSFPHPVSPGRIQRDQGGGGSTPGSRNSSWSPFTGN